jgi:hypothetical protein
LIKRWNILIGLPLDHPVPILTLYTNHSPIRWVVLPEGMAISVVCEASHLEEHINPLEIMVILLLLRHFEEQSLLIATDNMTVIVYLQN